MGLLDDRQDDLVCHRLIAVWRKSLGLNNFLKVRLGPKTMESVKLFHELAGRLGKTSAELIELACGRYSPSWCKETFKMNYPPFALVVGKATRKWLARELGQLKTRRTSTTDLASQAVEIVNTMLGTMPIEAARVLVDGGWPTDPALRAQVAEELKGRVVA